MDPKSLIGILKTPRDDFKSLNPGVSSPMSSKGCKFTHVIPRISVFKHNKRPIALPKFLATHSKSHIALFLSRESSQQKTICAYEDFFSETA